MKGKISNGEPISFDKGRSVHDIRREFSQKTNDDPQISANKRGFRFRELR